jgi:diguanylate cyclase (GGDEF)-like protein
VNFFELLDPRTLAASASLAGVVFSAVLFGAMRDGDPIAGARGWFVAALLISLGLFVNATQDMMPDMLARVIANVLLVVACFLIWQGARHFNGRSSAAFMVALAGAVTFVGNIAFTFVWPNVGGRIAITSLALMCGALFAALEILRAKGSHLRFGVLVTAAPLFLFAVFMVIRAINATLGHQTPTSLSPNPINVATHLIGNLVLLTTLAGLTIIVNATRAAHVRALAYSDQLTGVLSRRGFYSAMSSTRLGPKKNGHLFVFDIDQFKQVNDQKGHAIGDKLLVLLTSTIAERAPTGALIARFGGDEFVMVCDANIDAAQFVTKVKKIFRDRSSSILSESTLIQRTAQQMLTADVSVGHAVCENLADTQLAQALREADRAMYNAKIRQRPESDGVRGLPRA